MCKELWAILRESTKKQIVASLKLKELDSRSSIPEMKKRSGELLELFAASNNIIITKGYCVEEGIKLAISQRSRKTDAITKNINEIKLNKT